MEKLVKQTFNLTLAINSFSIRSMRVLALVVDALQSLMTTKVDYTNPTKDTWLKIKLPPFTFDRIKPVRKTLMELAKEKIYFRHYNKDAYEEKETISGILKDYKRKIGTSCIEMKIDGDFITQIIDLSRGYGKYNLSVALSISSVSTLKIYHYICHFLNSKAKVRRVECDIEYLRKWLHISDKYTPSKIKKWILSPAIKELRKKSDVFFDIEKSVKEGRTKKGWIFIIYRNPKKFKVTIPERKIQTDMYDASSLVLLEQMKNEFKLSNKQSRLLMNNLPKNEIKKTIKEIQTRGNSIKNIGAYTFAVFNTKYPEWETIDYRSILEKKVISRNTQLKEKQYHAERREKEKIAIFSNLFNLTGGDWKLIANINSLYLNYDDELLNGFRAVINELKKEKNKGKNVEYLQRIARVKLKEAINIW